LLEIFFESNKEVISFCEQLFYYNKKIDLYWKTSEEWGNRITFKNDFPVNEYNDAIAKSMTDVFIEHRLNLMMEEVIKGSYYYTDVEEIERILDLSLWIVTGNDRDSKVIRGEADPYSLLHSLFKANIEGAKTVHFDSIINFRLNVFKDHLIYLVGLAIDEYKREEEHQTFINMLRDYITNKEPLYHIVYVLQGTPFSFFKHNGKIFSRMELKKLMKREPLYIVGLDDNEWNLAPLIAMAPKQIYIYGDHPSEPKTSTVINIFQEKVIFKPYNKFPFFNYFKKL